MYCVVLLPLQVRYWVFCLFFQTTHVVLLCKGNSGLPSSSVQHDTFHLRRWRNHRVQPPQGCSDSLISVNELTERSLLFLYCYCCSCLKQESALFMDQALSIFRTLSRVVSSFNNEQEQIAARRMLAKSHRPQSSTSLRKHDTVTGPVTSNKTLNTWS